MGGRKALAAPPNFVRPKIALFRQLFIVDARDPFDGLIAARALLDDMTVITRDREIAAFGCKVLC